LTIIKFLKTYLFRKDFHFKVLEKINNFKRLNFKNAFNDQQLLMIGKKNLIIFDVGAHIGKTIKKYQSNFPISKIYAFEPYPPLYNELSNKFKNNSEINISQIGLSNKSGTTTFYLSKYENLNSFKKPNHRAWGFDDHYTIQVETTSLEKYCSKNSINYIDILKIDVQGSELDLLEGSEDLLINEKIGIIYIEWQVVPLYENHSLYFEISDFLKQFGYELFNIYNVNEARSGQMRWADAIFTSKSIRKNIISKFGNGQGSGW